MSHPLAIVETWIPPALYDSLPDLGDPRNLVAFGIRPDDLSSRDRATTQRISRKLHDVPAFRDKQWVVSYPHPVVGKLDQIGLLFSLSRTPGVIQGRPLLVGEHTKEIMASMGYSEDDMKTMEEQFAIGFVGMPRMPPRPAATQATAPKPGMASLLEKEAKK